MCISYLFEQRERKLSVHCGIYHLASVWVESFAAELSGHVFTPVSSNNCTISSLTNENKACFQSHGSLIFRGVLKNLRKGWNKWLERTPAKPALVAEGQKEQ